VTEEELENLYAEFDALLEQVRRMRRMIEMATDPAVKRLFRSDAKGLIAKFIRRNFADILAYERVAGFSDAKNIAMAVQPWFPIFGVPETERDVWYQVFKEMWLFEHGDEPEKLRPRQRKKGEHRHRGEMALRKLRALQWDALLQAEGLQQSRYRPEIELAFGADWQTIKKWRGGISKVLGPEFVEASILRAAEGKSAEGFLRYPDYHAALHESGALYRELKGLPVLTPADFRNKLENL
jgi:hypothetical protein